MAEGRTKALNQTVAQIKRRFGDGALMRMGESSHLDVEVIPTGALSLDIALGVGGLPRGRITEVYGPEGSGKTTICQHIVAQAQKMGGIAAFIDMEHALEPRYAAACGVDIESLYISQPDTGEQALEIAEALVRSGAVDVIVIDSVAALVPRAEIEGEMGDSHPGLQARLMSQALRKLSGAIKQSNAVMIFTNQLRMKIGVMFGSPETTSGGRALKFYATVRLDVRRIKSIKVKGEVIGHTTRVRVTKNKVAPPFRVAEFDIMFGEGISREGDLLDVGLNLGILDQRGSYYYYDDDNFAQGRENSKVYFQENPEFADKIETLIREELAERNKKKEKAEADEEEYEDVEDDEDGGDDED